MLSTVAEVLAILHARLEDARVPEDAWKLCSEIVLGNPEDGLSSLGACDIACKVCHLCRKRKVLGICTEKSKWGAGTQGVIPVLAANDGSKAPTQIGWGAGMQGLITVLGAHDGWKAPTQIRMGA